MEELIYWERIEEVGFLKGFFGTWFIVLFKPRLLFAMLKSSNKILPPFLFAWLNMFLSALFLTFIYGPRVGYIRPRGFYEILFEIGFMIVIIPIIFILPIFLFSLVINVGLVKSKLKSSFRLIFRLLCYTFSAIFLLFQAGVPLARYPFSFYLFSLWILIMVMSALKNTFQINLYKAANISRYFIYILIIISAIGLMANNRIIARLLLNESIRRKIFILSVSLFYILINFINLKRDAKKELSNKDEEARNKSES